MVIYNEQKTFLFTLEIYKYFDNFIIGTQNFFTQKKKLNLSLEHLGSYAYLSQSLIKSFVQYSTYIILFYILQHNIKTVSALNEQFGLILRSSYYQ